MSVATRSPSARDFLTALLHYTDPHCTPYDPQRFGDAVWRGHFAWDRKRAVKDLRLGERRVYDVPGLAEVIADLRLKPGEKSPQP